MRSLAVVRICRRSRDHRLDQNVPQLHVGTGADRSLAVEQTAIRLTGARATPKQGDSATMMMQRCGYTTRSVVLRADSLRPNYDRGGRSPVRDLRVRSLHRGRARREPAVCRARIRRCREPHRLCVRRRSLLVARSPASGDALSRSGPVLARPCEADNPLSPPTQQLTPDRQLRATDDPIAAPDPTMCGRRERYGNAQPDARLRSSRGGVEPRRRIDPTVMSPFRRRERRKARRRSTDDER